MAHSELSKNIEPPAGWIKKIPPNTRGRDFIVGDIHGCLDELLSLLAHAHFNPKRDRLFSVGDLVDRGPKSADSLNLLEKPWFFAARGNHEQMLIEHWDDPNANPAYDTAWLGDIHPDSIPYYKSLIESMPHILKVGHGSQAFYVMHAEIWENNELVDDSMIENCSFQDERQAFAKTLWSRHIVSSYWKNPDKRFAAPDATRIYCGHTIVQMPTAIENSVYIDTGAFAPFLDPVNAQAEHYGLSLIEASNLRHWFAPTCNHYRGTVVDMGTLDTSQAKPTVDSQIQQPTGPMPQPTST